MKKEIVEIARQIVKNKAYKTNVIGMEKTLSLLIQNKLAEKDKYGVSLNKSFVEEYSPLLIENGFTRYEIMLIEKGPFGVVYFNNELVQFFIHNPKYKFQWDGYRGHITSIDDKLSLQVYLENLCLAYDLKQKKPVISVFLKDLIFEQNSAFLAFLQFFEIYDIKHIIFHNYNFKELIEGQWLGKEEEDIYQVILSGMEIINKIFIQKYNLDFFIEIPMLDSLSYFKPIFYPTKLNFYLYIMELYKILNDNIKIETLNCLTGQKDKRLYQSLGTYLEKYNLDTRIQSKFVELLKKISDLRNIPGHDLFENIYDEDYWSQQDYFNQQLYIFINMIIRDEIKDISFELKEYEKLFGNNGRISMWNGLNVPPYNFYDKQIRLICENFEQRDSEILIAFKGKKEIKEKFLKYCKDKGVNYKDNELEKFIELLFNDLRKPTKEELMSFFKGMCFIDEYVFRGVTSDEYIKNGIKMYDSFIRKYPLENCLVIADMSDIRYSIDEINEINTLRDSGLIYNTIFDHSNNICLITNLEKESEIQVLVNTWD